jgi:hypothetical protein
MPELPLCNGQDIVVSVRPSDTGKIFAGIFRYPEAIVMPGQLFSQLGLSGTFRTGDGNTVCELMCYFFIWFMVCGLISVNG